jgi:hypothetical protein
LTKHYSPTHGKEVGVKLRSRLLRGSGPTVPKRRPRKLLQKDLRKASQDLTLSSTCNQYAFERTGFDRPVIWILLRPPNWRMACPPLLCSPYAAKHLWRAGPPNRIDLFRTNAISKLFPITVTNKLVQGCVLDPLSFDL